VPTALRGEGVVFFFNGLKPVATRCFEPTDLFNTGVDVFKGVESYGDPMSMLDVPALTGAGARYGYFNGDDTPLSGFLYSPQVGFESNRLQILAHYTATSVTGGSLSYFELKVFRLF
jgi:hypothetical protein